MAGERVLAGAVPGLCVWPANELVEKKAGWRLLTSRWEEGEAAQVWGLRGHPLRPSRLVQLGIPVSQCPVISQKQWAHRLRWVRRWHAAADCPMPALWHRHLKSVPFPHSVECPQQRLASSVHRPQLQDLCTRAVTSISELPKWLRLLRGSRCTSSAIWLEWLGAWAAQGTRLFLRHQPCNARAR